MSIALPESLTMQQASAVMAALQRLLRDAPGPQVSLDAAGLRELDTAAIAVLLQCRRQMQERGLAFSVSGVPPKLAALMSLYGVADLFGVAPIGHSADSAAP